MSRKELTEGICGALVNYAHFNQVICIYSSTRTPPPSGIYRKACIVVGQAAWAVGKAAAARPPRFTSALGAPGPSGTGMPLLCHHAATMPRGRSALPRRWQRRSPRGYWQDCPLNLLLQNRNNATKKKKKAASMINLQKKSANERGKGSKWKTGQSG